MQFTAAAVLRLVDRGALRLDDRVADVAPGALAGVAGGDAVTVRHLLEQRSGPPDRPRGSRRSSCTCRART
jgi:CubicO group peptidase (beta-lactamase class C family)